AHWAGQLSMARALALMGHADRAIAMATNASMKFCSTVGTDTLDCQRVRLATADIANWLGNVDVAMQKIASVTFTDAPAIAALLKTARALLELNRTPSEATVSAVDETLAAVTGQGGLGVRDAIRKRLGAAERLLATGHEALAEQLLAPLLLDPPAKDAIDGIDHIWLQLWQARAAGTLATQSALTDALAEELGKQHPSVLRWNGWRANSAKPE
ncbi:MAG: hypothetical protein ABI866_00305, partial [Dokdonella sp.]